MEYNVIPTAHFKQEVKKLSSHYPSFKDDLEELKKQLQVNPLIGDDLGGGMRKIRMKVKSKGKGKSGGVRVIEFIAYCDKEVFLISAYDKSSIENIKTTKLKKIAKQTIQSSK